MPCLSMPVVPGDKVKLQSTLINRMAPMVSPVMHQIKDYMHYFFVPFSQLVPRRYLDLLLSGGYDGTNEQVFPYTTLLSTIKLSDNSYTDWYLDSSAAKLYVGCNHPYVGTNSIANFLGLKLTFTTLSSSVTILSDDFKSSHPYCAVFDMSKIDKNNLEKSALYAPINLFPFLAYQKIYIDWYRDANYQPDFTYDDGIFRCVDSFGTYFDTEISGIKYDMGDGNKEHSFLKAVFASHNRAYQKDYFTSALPFPQRGPEVSVPDRKSVV